MDVSKDKLRFVYINVIMLDAKMLSMPNENYTYVLAYKDVDTYIVQYSSLKMTMIDLSKKVYDCLLYRHIVYIFYQVKQHFLCCVYVYICRLKNKLFHQPYKVIFATNKKNEIQLTPMFCIIIIIKLVILL